MSPADFDARLEACERRLTSVLTWRMLAIAIWTIVIVGLVDKFVRP
jgi:nitrate reductase NapE component